MMDDNLAAYLAGLFDGEGCTCIRHGNVTKRNKHAFHLWASISNNDVATLKKLQRSVGLGSVVPSDKTCRSWVMGDGQALQFLQLVYPYLRIKRNVAWIGICFQLHKEEVHAKRLATQQPYHGIPLPDSEVEARIAAKEIMSKINRRS